MNRQDNYGIISKLTYREILDRLLALNHQRYAEEVAQSLHDKKKKKKTATRKRTAKTALAQPPSKANAVQGNLF